MKQKQNMTGTSEVVAPLAYGALVDGLDEMFQGAKRKVATAIDIASKAPSIHSESRKPKAGATAALNVAKRKIEENILR